jgi:ribosomal protein S18 acetylase RimI-like enzyme
MTLIRPATPADRVQILRLTERLGDFPVPPWRTAAEIARADHPILLAALGQPAADSLLLVAEEGDRLRGFLFAAERADYFTGERLAHVEDLALEPGAEGKGLARRLMEAAEAWARGRGCRRVTLNVWAQNERAVGLYRRLGYQPETVHYLKELEP